MKAIVDFLSGIGDGIMAVVDFVIGFFEDVVYVVKLTGEFVLQIPSYLSWLPPEVLAIVVTIFTVVVLYKILGREG